MASSTEICNLALSLLGQEPIVTMDDATKSSRLCIRFYDQTLDYLLRSHSWTFAIHRVSLAAEQETPAFGFAFQYKLPQDCRRVVELNIPDGHYCIERNRVLTDYTDVQLRYVQSVLDPNDMDAVFIDMFATELASRLCLPITADGDLYKFLRQRTIEIAAEARYTDSIETAAPKIIEGPWLPSRS